MSPTTRASRAISRADSIRQMASIARCASAPALSRRPGWAVASPFRGLMASAPSHALELDDLADLEGPAVVGCPLEPLEGLVDRAHLPQPVPGHELLGLRERPVDDGALLAVESNALALGTRVEAARLEDHSRLDQLLVELLVFRHGFRGGGSRRLALVAFVGHDQNSHLCLLLLQFRWFGLRGLTHSSNDRRPFRHPALDSLKIGGICNESVAFLPAGGLRCNHEVA